MKASIAHLVLILALTLGAGITACQKINPQEKAPQVSLLVRRATIQLLDENKLCGHRVAFLLKDGTYILPTNLNSFLKEPFHNQTVQITYRSEDSKITDCRAAKSVYLSHVDIPSLSDLD